jgi:hypothetical protein
VILVEILIGESSGLGTFFCFYKLKIVFLDSMIKRSTSALSSISSEHAMPSDD